MNLGCTKDKPCLSTSEFEALPVSGLLGFGSSESIRVEPTAEATTIARLRAPDASRDRRQRTGLESVGPRLCCNMPTASWHASAGSRRS